MNSIRLALAAVFASSFVVGCAVDTSNESATENVASESDALSAAATCESDLKADWQNTAGGTIRSIAFTDEAARTVDGRGDKKFTAVLDTGIRCITTPCPSETTVTGIYKASATSVTLLARDKPTALFNSILGTYKVTTTDSSLTLKKDGATQTFGKVAAFCVTYETTDAGHTFFAQNVATKKAGQAVLKQVRGEVNGLVTAGACNAPQMCTFIYMPVCAGESQFGNLCGFKGSVRAAAGNLLGAKPASDTWVDGACPVFCTDDSQCDDGFCSRKFSDAPQVCRPYSHEGGPCGGFTTPDHQSSCDPTPVDGRTLTCVHTDLTFDIPGTCQFQ